MTDTFSTFSKWRYTYYNYNPASDDSYEEMMNNLGAEGWELVSAYLAKNNEGNDLHRHIFKRPNGPFNMEEYLDSIQ
tara:strand:+ start:136 stop:366 length:231 start_codon:yes stop_codon:yes gene_type:complete